MSTIKASYTQQYSPAEKAKRIRRCWMALKQGVLGDDLVRAGRFSEIEVNIARAEMRKAQGAQQGQLK